MAEIEKLREESSRLQDSGSPTLDWREAEGLRESLKDLKAKYTAFGGTIPAA
ncbi:MAG: hypothetical protein ABJC13_19245 [Acidobacteriota bacterium]